ncbi:hypothetical protein LT988_04925 [Thiocapsa bogorovii]|nr:hypothetical protein [Thiocapsa bogorovii]UHD17396.1 hypothetical protein LT988_04925 [Thiocapsa bogorovii]
MAKVEQRILGFECRPGVRSDHHDAFMDLQNIFNTRDIFCPCFVHMSGFAAKNRTMGDGRVQHIRKLDVHAETRFAVDLFRDIGSGNRLTNDRKLILFFEEDPIRDRLFHRSRDKLSVGFLASGRDMNNRTQYRPTFTGRNRPFFSCRIDQHFPSNGTCLPECHPSFANTAAASGHLETVHRIQRGMLNTDKTPIDLELFGHHHWHESIGTLPHLALGDDNRNHTI